MLQKKRIIITAGEPASISTEITVKSLQNYSHKKDIEIICITDPNLVKHYCNKSNIKLPINILSTNHKFNDYKYNFINILPIKLSKMPSPGVLDEVNCNFVVKSILKAIYLLNEKLANAMVTCPINKFLLKKNGFKYNGHTEFLASHSKKKKIPIMLLHSYNLNVVPLTTHIPIKDISKNITKKLLIEKIEVLNDELKTYLKIKKPRIYVSGLNPHSGDNGVIGKEEIETIIPAISYLQKKGINVFGPISGDIMFEKKIRKKFDVAVCMFHDQALIPIKTLNFNKVVNITLGLDFLRTSPDHGTALDIAGHDLANPTSMMLAIKKAEQLIKKK